MVVAALALALAACGTSGAAPEAPPTSAVPTAADGEVVTETAPAPSLANNMLGDPAEREIADYLALPDRLAEIKVAYGTTDIYRWIPIGSAYFLDLLAENDISHSEFVFEGGHGVNYFFFQQDCVDYFSRTLTA